MSNEGDHQFDGGVSESSPAGVIPPTPGQGNPDTDVVRNDPGQSCSRCASPAPSSSNSGSSAFVYAVGRIEPRFPSLSLEKEVAQAVGRAETVTLTDRQAIRKVLAKRENRYLVRQICWILTVQGLETYILRPRDPGDFDLLLDALRGEPEPQDLDVVVGMLGGPAPHEMCNGLILPVVFFDQIYSFNRESLIKSIPRPEDFTDESFLPAASEVLDRILQLTGNAGVNDEHRALNYLAMRYPAIYAKTASAFANDESLSAVDVLPSSVGAPRIVLDVVFSYTNRKTDVMDKSFVRVDVSEEFPFLVTKMAPYLSR